MTDSIDHATCMGACDRERPVAELVVRRDRDAAGVALCVRVCSSCAEAPRYVAPDGEQRDSIYQHTVYPSEVTAP